MSDLYPVDPTLRPKLVHHLALWLSNTPRCNDARELADALLDPNRYGPLADYDFVLGLVTNSLQTSHSSAPPTKERPDHSARSLHIVKHPHRPGTTEFTVDT